MKFGSPLSFPVPIDSDVRKDIFHSEADPGVEFPCYRVSGLPFSFLLSLSQVVQWSGSLDSCWELMKLLQVRAHSRWIDVRCSGTV